MAELSVHTKKKLLDACDRDRINAIAKGIDGVFQTLNVSILEAFMALEVVSCGVVLQSEPLQRLIENDTAFRVLTAIIGAPEHEPEAN